MENEFVPYQQALNLKELGFDELCFAHYCNGDLITKTAILKSSTMLYYQQNNINPNNQYKHQNCTAPLYQQAFRWFREKHNLYIEIILSTYGMLNANVNNLLNDSDGKRFITNCDNICYESDYKEAELECLKKLIKIVKNK